MLFDVKLLFGDEEAIVADGAMGDPIDLNDPNLNLDVGEQAFFGIVITEDLATATQVVFSVTSCDTWDGSYTELVTTAAIAAANVIQGKQFKLPIPAGCQQFIQLYSVAASVSAGAVTAGVVG